MGGKHSCETIFLYRECVKSLNSPLCLTFDTPSFLVTIRTKPYCINKKSREFIRETFYNNKEASVLFLQMEYLHEDFVVHTWAIVMDWCRLYRSFLSMNKRWHYPMRHYCFCWTDSSCVLLPKGVDYALRDCCQCCIVHQVHIVADGAIVCRHNREPYPLDLMEYLTSHEPTFAADGFEVHISMKPVGRKREGACVEKASKDTRQFQLTGTTPVRDKK